ncbi:MAG TPA: ankyrin repeat domain-containing protein, partial [Blastocatellia bacterium]|nr:ankyrin repeat domain-containing protein [Blastocatellia bacterium]
RQFRVAIAVLVVLGCAFNSSVALPQPQKAHADDWQLDTSFGFPVWVGANIAPKPPAIGSRYIYLYIEAQDFTEKNIRTVFTTLAAKYKKPKDIWIYAYSDKTVVQQGIDEQEGPIICSGSFADSPEGRRAARNKFILREPRGSGYFRARYYRFNDGREQMEYSPKAEQQHVRTINLKAPTPAYTGDAKADLVLAIEDWDTEKAKALIVQIKDTNITGKWGYPIVTIAALYGQKDVVLALLDKGADVNAKTALGSTPLMSAAFDGGVDVAQLLIDRGADISVEDSRGDTALIAAALHGHKRIVQALVAKGAEVDQRNIYGETALICAALAGYPDIVEFLASKGADINARDYGGRTALMWARDDAETVQALIRNGADYRLVDNEGKTAIILAIEGWSDKKAQALADAGAGPESIELAKAALKQEPPKGRFPADYYKGKAYKTLTELYLKVGYEKEAVATAKAAVAEAAGLPGQPHLICRLGATYLSVGDKKSALKQYRILVDGAKKAKDPHDKGNWQSWAEALLEQIEEFKLKSN